jgi:hypothetical protein
VARIIACERHSPAPRAQIAIATLLERFPSLQPDPEYAVEHKRAPVFNGLEALGCAR